MSVVAFGVLKVRFPQARGVWKWVLKGKAQRVLDGVDKITVHPKIIPVYPPPYQVRVFVTAAAQAREELTSDLSHLGGCRALGASGSFLIFAEV